MRLRSRRACRMRLRKFSAPSSPGSPPLHALSIAEILRHTRLADGDRLADCFTAINRAFQSIRNDPEATLFGFDQYGHVFIHQTTHDSVRQIWEQLFAIHPPLAAGPVAAEGPMPAGFSPPRLGPSEDIAQQYAADRPHKLLRQTSDDATESPASQARRRSPHYRARPGGPYPRPLSAATKAERTHTSLSRHPRRAFRRKWIFVRVDWRA